MFRLISIGLKFKVVVRIRQGCLLSLTLFNLFLDFVKEKVKCLQKAH